MKIYNNRKLRRNEQFCLEVEYWANLTEEEKEEANNYFYQEELPEILEGIAETELNEGHYDKKYELDKNRRESYIPVKIQRIDDQHAVFGAFIKYFHIGNGKAKSEIGICFELCINFNTYNPDKVFLYYQVVSSIGNYPDAYFWEDIAEQTNEEEKKEIEEYIDKEIMKIKAAFRNHTTGWNKTEALLESLELGLV